MYRAVRLSSVIICEGGNDVWDRGQKEELIDGKWVEDLLKICYLGPKMFHFGMLLQKRYA